MKYWIERNPSSCSSLKISPFKINEEEIQSVSNSLEQDNILKDHHQKRETRS